MAKIAALASTGMTVHDIGNRIGRAPGVVQRAIKKHGFLHPVVVDHYARAQKIKWTPEMDQFIHDHWQSMTQQEIGIALGVHAGSVGYRMREKLGIDVGKVKSVGPNADTPIGTIRAQTTGGELGLRIRVPKERAKRGWMPYAAYVWEEANGPVPDGKMVFFADGQTRLNPDEVTPDVLTVMDRAEWIEKHGIRAKMPKELADLAIMRGVLDKMIKRRMQNEG